jgi:hypothetical protein
MRWVGHVQLRRNAYKEFTRNAEVKRERGRPSSKLEDTDMHLNRNRMGECGMN